MTSSWPSYQASVESAWPSSTSSPGPHVRQRRVFETEDVVTKDALNCRDSVLEQRVGHLWCHCGWSHQVVSVQTGQHQRDCQDHGLLGTNSGVLWKLPSVGENQFLITSVPFTVDCHWGSKTSLQHCIQRHPRLVCRLHLLLRHWALRYHHMYPPLHILLHPVGKKKGRRERLP